jgi:hypothetical protein
LFFCVSLIRNSKIDIEPFPLHFQPIFFPPSISTSRSS